MAIHKKASKAKRRIGGLSLMNNDEQTVLITNATSRTSYATLRNLRKYGIKTYVSDTSVFGMSQFSRFSSGFSKYPSFYEDENIFIEEVQKIVKNRHVSLIIPSHNETEIFAKNKEAFSAEALRIVPKISHIELFNNKKLSYDYVENLSITTPRRINYEHPDEITKNLKRNGIKKTVIKLLTGNSSKGVFYAESEIETENLVKNLITKFNLKHNRYPQIEEKIYGKGFGCSVLYWEGELIACSTHKRLREKIATGGTSTLRKIITNNKIEKVTKKIFDSIEYHGLAMCEFKYDEENDKLWFIEVNPRMWGSMPVAIDSGVEYPYLAFLCATKGASTAKEFFKNSQKNVPWTGKWLLGDTFLFLTHLKNMNIRDALSMINFEYDSIDDFNLKDPLPFFGQLFSYLANTIKNRSTNPVEKG